MKLVLPEQIRALDEAASTQCHIPSILLMEHAAWQVFKVIQEKHQNRNITIVCGPGNNGGDGLALGRQLKTWGFHDVKVLMLAQKKKLTADGKIYYDIGMSIELEILHINESNSEKAYEILKETHVIVDAIFGTGLTRHIEGLYAYVIEAINRSKAYKISVDLPSGIDGSMGKVLGIAVRADETVTFAMPKLGLYVYPAIDYTGKVSVVDIGIPKALIDEIKTPYFTIDKAEVEGFLPTRYTRSNKGTYGKVLMIGGQTGMSGAITLASRAASKVGAGTVTAAVPSSIHDIMEQKLTEVMTIPLQDHEGHIALQAIDQIEKLIEKYDVIAIGPGLGRHNGMEKILLTVLASNKPCIIDADALFFLNTLLEMVRSRKAETIITPHPGEMARLTQLSISEILEDPLTITQQFAIKNNVTTVLKIERTVIGSPTGSVYINNGGNNGMAKGGTGDILTGIIAGILAQKSQAEEAVKLGVYLHARAGDIMSDIKTQYTILPTDLFEGIDKAFKEIVGN